jgi:hypothetical protein
MKSLEIDVTSAKSLYPSAKGEFKTLLEVHFGTDTLVAAGNITDKIKTFEDACKAVGTDPASLEFTIGTPDEQAYKKIKVIVRALNEGWTPDWKDDDEWKYYPWFDFSSGSGLSYYGYDNRCSNSFVGSRLCFKSSELAEYAGKQFIDLYTQFMIH